LEPRNYPADSVVPAELSIPASHPSEVAAINSTAQFGELRICAFQEALSAATIAVEISSATRASPRSKSAGIGCAPAWI
jgi:hypothetical protein